MALAVIATNGYAQQMPDMPVDQAVRIGKLENGLTYYIRHNEEPKDQAAFYIVHKVGSVQEDDNQRGLAHFLEHMAFNGSKHFKAGSVFPFLKRNGVTQFNAETGVDETCYHLDNVPVTDKLVVDSCLMLLSDWSCGVELTQEEIEKERDVIHGEYRMRNSPMERILERQLGVLYPNSKYADRMPIGVMEIIDNFSPEFLEAYYKKWYHPDIQGVVVVGDIDVDYIENKIKEYFSPLKNPENETAYELYPVPDNETAIYVLDKDKDMKANQLMIFFKHPVFPFEMRGNAAFEMNEYINNVLAIMLNNRLREVSLNPECPFIMASISDGDYLLSKTCGALNVVVVAKPGQNETAVQCVMTEIARARQHGFTNSELKRASEQLLSEYEHHYNNRNKEPHSFYADQYRVHFTKGNAIPDIETEYELMKSLASQLPAQVFQQVIMGYTESIDKNFVMLGLFPDDESQPMPSVEAMKAAVAAGISAQTEAYAEEESTGPLVEKLPKPVKVKKTETAPFGFTKMTLKNGANIYYKKTDFTDNEIGFSAVSKGGFNKLDSSNDPLRAIMISPADGSRHDLFELMSGTLCVGDYTITELMKKMAGKKADINYILGSNVDILSGNAVVKDVKTLFELIYLVFQGPGNDANNFNMNLNTLKGYMPQLDAEHSNIQNDSVLNTLYAHHPAKQMLHASTTGKISMEQVRTVLADRYQSVGDFDFIFSGAIDEDVLRSCVEQYIAPLPGLKKRETSVCKEILPVKGMVENVYQYEMPSDESAEAIVTVIWSCQESENYSMKNYMTLNALATVLSNRYFQKIREEGSMGYSAFATCDAEGDIKPMYLLKAGAFVKPEKKDDAVAILYAELNDIAKNGVNADELQKFIKPTLTSYAESCRTDEWWMTVLQNKLLWDKDIYTGREETIKSVTSDDIKAFANDYVLKQNNRCTVIMVPKK